jgi:hypothetical protein
MTWKRSAALAALLVTLGVAGCGGDAPATEITADDFDSANFDSSPSIDNEWIPMEPGTQLTYEGSTSEDGERIGHRVVFTVTDMMKTVNGVPVLVIWERDWSTGHLEEAELAFFAEDKDGNVWHLGQYPEVYEEGELVEAPAWIAGTDGAKAGITMKSSPKLGAPDYSQGFAPPPVNWVDRAEVHSEGVKTCVPYDCFEDVLVTREFEVGKPDAYQLKYYARGVGNVRVGWLGKNDKDHEVLQLTKVEQLGPAAMDEARASALELEKNAYKIRKKVYGATTPMTPLDAS